MTMNITRGLYSGGCGNPARSCCNPCNDFEPYSGAPAPRQNNCPCCRSGAPRNPCGCCCCREPEDVSSIKILCTDENCNGICNTVFTLETPDGCCKTIDLKNCGRSADLPLPHGCAVLKNISTPRGFLPLEGSVFCEVCDDSCGHPICTVTSEGCSEERISVCREAGTTIITVKFPRAEGSGCGDGCDRGGL